MADDHASFPHQPSPEGEASVRDRKAALIRDIPGAGALADRPLKLRPGIDLTKPIYDQVFGES